MKSKSVFLSENFQFLMVKFLVYLNRRVVIVSLCICVIQGSPIMYSKNRYAGIYTIRQVFKILQFLNQLFNVCFYFL